VKTLASANPETAAARLKKVSRLRPKLAIVLGSGFHHALTELRVDEQISYAKIPGFPKPTVSGHAGEVYFGNLGGTPVLVLSGRAHFYEGHPMERVTFAVRALAAFGITDLLLTNAAGGINRKFRAGDFMVLTDHINFMGVNPLRGPAIFGLNRFVDLTAFVPGRKKLQLQASARRLSGRERAELRNAGGNPRVHPARRGCGGHEHGAGGGCGAAMRIERGGGFMYHESGGGRRQGKIVPCGSAGHC
jgi:purine nucleoside phosphorylase